MSNNFRRILTALVAAPVLLGLAYLGGWPFAVLIAGIGLAGQAELYRMARRVGASPQGGSGLLLGGLVIVVLVRPALWPLLVGILLLFVVVAPFLIPQKQFLSSFTVTIAGAVYPTALLGGLVLLRNARGPYVDDTTAFSLVLLTFFLVWATDIFAYYVGRWRGTHALVPSISPNKTWEGTFGGLGAAVAVGVLMKVLWIDVLSWGHLAVIILIGGGISQLGDLLESQLKRSTSTDDSSDILPGHGGILDRFDALAVAAPLIYLYLAAVVEVV